MRLYGWNISRSYRNHHEQAVDDAVSQTNTALVFVYGSLVALLLAILYPDSMRPPFRTINFALVVIFAPILFVVSRILRNYAEDTKFIEMAEQYRLPQERVITIVCFFTLPFICIGVLIIAFHAIEP